MKKKKTNNLFYIIIFIQGLIFAGLFSMAHPQKAFSGLENRTLAKIPSFSVKKVLDGSYQDQMEKGLKDQSVLKTPAVRLAVFFDLATAHYDKNGTYFSPDGVYVKKETDDDYTDQRLSLNARIITRFADQTGQHADLCLIPPKGAAEPNELPSYAPYLDDLKLREKIFKDINGNEKVGLIPMENLLSSDRERYFRTDHHYNTYGAYLSVKDYLTRTGFPTASIDRYVLSTVGEDFHGTLFRKAPLFEDSYDHVTIPSNLPDVKVKYSYGGDGRLDQESETDSLYEAGYMFTEDKYSVYMGGNHGLAVIENQKKKEGPVLFMVKDSFANSAVPYLIRSYKRIVMVDLRYFSGSVQDLVKKYDPDRTVIWYESLDFAQESRFPMLLR